jgi:hypothetical protein
MKWHYQVIETKLENQYLNTWGDMGWELVCVLPGTSGQKVLVFKQPKPEPGR